MLGIKGAPPSERQLDLEESRLRLEQQKFLWEISQKSVLPNDIVDLVQKSKDFNTITERALISAIKPQPELPAPEETKSRAAPTTDLGFKPAAPTAESENVTKKKQTVFISYCWKNSVHEFKREGKPPSSFSKAGPCDPREIKDVLRSAGHDVWIDIEYLEDGKSLEDQLFLGLNKASLVVAFISRQYVMSENCKNEFAFAKKLKLPIVPVIVGTLADEDWSQSQVGFALGNALYIDARDPTKLEQVKERIKKTVNDKLGIQVEAVAKPTEESTEETTADENAEEGETAEANVDENVGDVVNTVITSEINAIDSYDPKSMGLAIENIKMYLNDTPSLLNEQDSEGRTPLSVAIERGHIEIVQFLLEQPDVDVNIANNYGQTPLFTVCCIDSNDYEVAQKKLQILELLFTKNADPTVTSYGRNVLHALCEIGDTNSLIVILDQYRDLIPEMINHYTDNNVMPLESALMSGHIGCAWVLLSAGASATRLEDAPAGAWSPLDCAARGNLRGFKMVLQNGATLPKEPGINPIHSAALTANVEIARLMLDDGVPIDLPNENGETALLIAASYGHLDFVNFMLERGADPSVKSATGFDTFLYSATTEVLESLLKYCKDINHVYTLPDGLFTLVSYAVNCDKDEDYVKALIDAEASLTPSMPGQKSPLYFAIDSGSTSVVKLIVESGAPDFSDPHILNYAARLARMDVIKYFVEKGCDLNRTDKNGLHILIAAIEGIDLTEEDGVDDVAETAKYLLDLGVNLNVYDPFTKRSPLHVAAVRGCEKVVEELLNRGVDAFATDINGMTPVELTEPKSWDKPEDITKKESIREMIVQKFPKAMELLTKVGAPKHHIQSWEGAYYDDGESYDKVELRVVFNGNSFEGNGDGEIGSFRFSGEMENELVHFKLFYKFSTREFTGQYDDSASTIHGTWKYPDLDIIKEGRTFELSVA